MHVSAIIGEKGSAVFSVGPDESVGAAIAVLSDKRIGAVLVTRDDQVLGIFSERDVINALARAGAGIMSQPVKDFMSTDVVTCRRGDSIDHMMGLMTDRRIRHLPVIEDGKVVGMISIGDVVKFRIAEAEAESDALKSYIASG
jgi:CBS domain-containing protein